MTVTGGFRNGRTLEGGILMMDKSNISKPTLRRLPVYLNYLKSLPEDTRTISVSEKLSTSSIPPSSIRFREKRHTS